MLRVLIADDEPLARQRLRRLLQEEPGIEIVAECGTGRDTAGAIRKETPDVVFLDIQMPGGDGFDVVEEIGADRMPAVVFITAYDQYAVKAFEVHALDYLLKPFDRERFQEALRRVRSEVEGGRDGGLSERLVSLLAERVPGARHAERIAVRDAGRLLVVRADEIDWIGSAGNYVELHVGGKAILHRETLSGIEERLDPRRFLRIHRTAIVNADRVRELRPLFRGEHQVLLRDGTTLTLSRSYRDRVLQALGEKS